MLINAKLGTIDPALKAIFSLLGQDSSPKELRTGVYEIGHRNGRYIFAENLEVYPVLGDIGEFKGRKFGNFGPYGVCDSVEQLLAACPELEAPGREFVVTVTPVRKSEQPSDGGWRWHKWGEYIGTQDPQCEYLHDEPHIEQVLCFHIYERV